MIIKLDIHPSSINEINSLATSHWKKLSDKKEEWERIIQIALLEQHPNYKQIDYPVEIYYYLYGLKSNRDIDNIYIKPFQDGLVKFGLFKDDNRNYIKKISVEYIESKKRYTEIEILHYFTQKKEIINNKKYKITECKINTGGK